MKQIYSHCSLPIFCSSTKVSEDIKIEEDNTIFINNLLLPKGLSDNEYDLNCSLKQKSVMQLMKLGEEKP